MSFYRTKHFQNNIRANQKTALLSILLASSIFFTIPLMNQINRQKKQIIVRDIPIIHTKKKKPEKVLKIRKKIKQNIKMKTRSNNINLTPQKLKVNLTLKTPVDAGDFNLNFSSFPILKSEDFVFELKQVDTSPRPILRIPPQYPLKAKMKRIEGVVELLFTVTSKGSIENISILKSKPLSIFDEAAKNAILKWKFKPALKNGKPVSVRVSLPLHFKMD